MKKIGEYIRQFLIENTQTKSFLTPHLSLNRIRDRVGCKYRGSKHFCFDNVLMELASYD